MPLDKELYLSNSETWGLWFRSSELESYKEMVKSSHWMKLWVVAQVFHELKQP